MIVNDNIKLIRELSGKTQKVFAKLIRTNLSNLKTYENTETRPKANVIAAVADIAGISVEVLENKKLTHKDVVFQTTKVDKDDKVKTGVAESPAEHPFLERLLSEKEATMKQVEARRQEATDRAKRAEDQVDNLFQLLNGALSTLATNSTETQILVRAILDEQSADDKVMMDNQDKQMKHQPGSSSELSGNMQIIAAQARQNKGKKAGAGK